MTTAAIRAAYEADQAALTKAEIAFSVAKNNRYDADCAARASYNAWYRAAKKDAEQGVKSDEPT